MLPLGPGVAELKTSLSPSLIARFAKLIGLWPFKKKQKVLKYVLLNKICKNVWLYVLQIIMMWSRTAYQFYCTYCRCIDITYVDASM